jgi:hypothetical protein
MIAIIPLSAGGNRQAAWRYKTPALHRQINAALETVCMMIEVRHRVSKLGYDLIGACPGDQARLRISRRMADAG